HARELRHVPRPLPQARRLQLLVPRRPVLNDGLHLDANVTTGVVEGSTTFPCRDVDLTTPAVVVSSPFRSRPDQRSERPRRRRTQVDESHSIVGMDRRQLLLRGAALATAVGTFGSVERAMAAGRAGEGLELWHWQAGNAYPDIFGAAGKRWSTKTEGKFHQTSVPYTSYWAKFKTAVAGGSTPDVMEMSWTGQYRDLIKANTLAPLDASLTKGFPAFYKTVMDSLAFRGKHYAIPLD